MNEYGCASPGLLFGGNANNGTNAGLSYANANNAPSNANANIGSRIYYNEHKTSDANHTPQGEKQ